MNLIGYDGPKVAFDDSIKEAIIESNKRVYDNKAFLRYVFSIPEDSPILPGNFAATITDGELVVFFDGETIEKSNLVFPVIRVKVPGKGRRDKDTEYLMFKPEDSQRTGPVHLIEFEHAIEAITKMYFGGKRPNFSRFRYVGEASPKLEVALAEA